MQTMPIETDMTAAAAPWRGTEAPLSVQLLAAAAEREVLEFLSARPIHTVFIRGYIRDNGLVSDLNRGEFYGCRDARGRLVGVALVGHITLIETRDDIALRALAKYVRGQSIYMILGEQYKVERFWDSYTEAGEKPRQQRHELLFVQHCLPPLLESVPKLRLAVPDDLPILLPLYGEMHRQESGVNPLEVDPEGFGRRWMRRIEQNHVWVWTEGERLMFNADVMCDTPDCIYLEGVYVAPGLRRRGYGLRCMSQLSHRLLARAKWLCLLSDDRNLAANEFYRKAGYNSVGIYKTIFLDWTS